VQEKGGALKRKRVKVRKGEESKSRLGMRGKSN